MIGLGELSPEARVVERRLRRSGAARALADRLARAGRLYDGLDADAGAVEWCQAGATSTAWTSSSATHAPTRRAAAVRRRHEGLRAARGRAARTLDRGSPCTCCARRAACCCPAAALFASAYLLDAAAIAAIADGPRRSRRSTGRDGARRAGARGGATPRTRSGCWTASPRPASRPSGSATARGRAARRALGVTTSSSRGCERAAPAGVAGLELIDVRHLGRPHVICCRWSDDVHRRPGAGVAPAQALLAALGGPRAARAILLTHIHLDHAGATGRARAALAGRRGLGPRARRAAPDRPVEADRQRDADLRRRHGAALGRDRARCPRTSCASCAAASGSARWRVAYTPGHASHHVTYLHEPTGTAFCGDVAGVQHRRRPGAAADAAAGHRPRGVARVARLSAAGPGAAASSRTSASSRTPRAHLDELRANLGRARGAGPRPRRRGVRARRSREEIERALRHPQTPPRCCRRCRPTRCGRASTATGESAPRRRRA